jgi:hypothetical protein
MKREPRSEGHRRQQRERRGQVPVRMLGRSASIDLPGLSVFINPQLQLGVVRAKPIGTASAVAQSLRGRATCLETAEAVGASLCCFCTSLKRGVNESIPTESIPTESTPAESITLAVQRSGILWDFGLKK